MGAWTTDRVLAWLGAGVLMLLAALLTTGTTEDPGWGAAVTGAVAGVVFPLALGLACWKLSHLDGPADFRTRGAAGFVAMVALVVCVGAAARGLTAEEDEGRDGILFVSAPVTVRA